MELAEILIDSIKYTISFFIIILIPSYIAYRFTGKKKAYTKNIPVQRLAYISPAPLNADERIMKRFKVIKLNYHLEFLTDSTADFSEDGNSYEFSNKDLSLILFYINRIRGIIRTSVKISYNYKQRLFEKLNNLQAGLQNELLTLNNIYGCVVDIAVASSGVHKEIGPLLNDILKIAAETQAFTDNVPPSSFTAGEYTPLQILELNPEYMGNIDYAAENNLRRQIPA